MTTRSSSASSGGGRAAPGAVVREVLFGGGDNKNNKGRGPSARTAIDPAAREALTRMLGRVPSDKEVRAMVGAPPTADVFVEPGNAHNYADAAEVVKFRHAGPPVPVVRGLNRDQTLHLPLYGGDDLGGRSDRTLILYRDGTMEMRNSTFRVLPEYQGNGVGLRMLADEVRALSAMGVKRIGAQMAGSFHSSDQGYRRWPQMGYDTRPGALKTWREQLLRRDMRDIVSPEARAALQKWKPNGTLLDLYAIPGGREVWARHGYAVDGYFDLTPGSRSMVVLHGYARAKGIDINDPWAGFDTAKLKVTPL